MAEEILTFHSFTQLVKKFHLKGISSNYLSQLDHFYQEKGGIVFTIPFNVIPYLEGDTFCDDYRFAFTDWIVSVLYIAKKHEEKLLPEIKFERTFPMRLPIIYENQYGRSS